MVKVWIRPYRTMENEGKSMQAPTRIENKVCVSVCVCVRVQTHTRSDAISFNSSNCCHRHFLLALPLRSLENSAGRLVCKLIMGEMGACVIPLLSITHFLPFSIPLAIYPFLLSSCLPFSCSDRSPFDLGVDQISTRDGREEMTPPPLQPRSLGLTQFSRAALFSTGVTSACGLCCAADCVMSIFRSLFSFRR